MRSARGRQPEVAGLFCLVSPCQYKFRANSRTQYIAPEDVAAVTQDAVVFFDVLVSIVPKLTRDRDGTAFGMPVSEAAVFADIEIRERTFIESWRPGRSVMPRSRVRVMSQSD